ncbi:dihydroneopterin aldolase [Polymorphobacter fuscus]|uniref:dihydroneopterin aldolase n=1 Tax=Sandarakinorhabdus fusca TaxID=1439888 RepID=A0A7C9KWQ2_9SPHN|nr:dihydroneopterin aldolase [Polymorphobacter fuscus]KAB7648650.1 dihydroneopterin aldolase [Polymorphobacter fuscus]MQT16206.1 dihydroneopterin aldolase [Polymorphobacter fuscus]NJC07509.1 dihydroneopterin aldolase [Polymorphobacter fuscus]
MIEEQILATDAGELTGLVPPGLAPRSRKIMLEDFDIPVDIGFHDFEIGTPQRLRVNLEIWLSAAHFPDCDTVASAWDYDVLRTAVLALVSARRFNLQETVAHAIYNLIAARQGVVGLRVSTRKPDIYPDCSAVGVELSSF